MWGRRGWIYFVQAGGLDRPIKIGFATNVQKRLAQLQQGSPEILTLIAKMEGTQREEYRIHKLFREEHIRAEWFKPSVRLNNYIVRMRGDEECADE